MTRRQRSSLQMGYDSFLDIVANLVGILIILVVVLGAQSRRVAADAARESLEASQEVQAFEKAAARSRAAMAAVAEIRRQQALYDLEIASRRQERAVLMDLLAVAEEKWQEKQQALDENQQRAVALTAELAAKQRELKQLSGEKSRLENTEPETAVVEHLPSPMAKTVFGDEIHLRLKAGRLSVVPIESLVGEIRRAFRSAVDGLEPGSSIATVGPIRGYLAEYRVQRSRATVNQGGSVGTAVRMELTGMVIEPIEDNLGEPLDRVLETPRSMLDIELAGRTAETTTVTVWVYPDSFAAFRRLKEHLHRRGVATAARPLPEGRPISGGPDGSRSSAQ
jgi:hypothetical protein